MDFQQLIQKAAANQKVAEKVVSRVGSGFYPIVLRQLPLAQHNLSSIHKLYTISIILDVSLNTVYHAGDSILFRDRTRAHKNGRLE